MTDGPNNRLIGSNPTLFTNRNITVNNVSGNTNGGVVLGGFTDDYTAMNGAVQLNGPAIFYAAQRGRVDFTGPISGTGAVQIGATNPVYVEGAGTTAGSNGGLQLGPNGTIAFTVANSYSGSTTVDSGRLLVNGSLYASSSSSTSSTVTVSAGTLGGTGTIYGQVSLANGTTLEAGMASGSPLTLANGVTFPSSYFGTNVTISFDSVGPPGSPGLVINNGLNNVGVTGTLNPNSQTITITGAISSTGSYALIATDPGDAATLANAATTSFTLGSLPNRAQGSLQINPTNPDELDLLISGLYSVAWTGANGSDWNALGNFLQIGGVDQYGKFESGDAVVFSDSATNTNVTLTSGNVGPSSMTFENHTSTYTISGSASINAGSLSLTNGGTLVIENTNTFSGLTSIGPGSTLQLGNGTAGSDGDLPNTTVLDNGSLVYSLSGQQVFGGAISGAGSLYLKSGALTLTSTANTFSGGTTISGGTLQIGSNTAPAFDGSLVGAVTDNSTFVFANFANGTFGGSISGSGAVIKAASFNGTGGGVLAFTNANAYTGLTTISNGTLQLGNGQAGHDGLVGGPVADNGVLAFDEAANETFGGAIGGGGALTTLGGHTLTLTNIETYSGLTTISAGTLQLGNGAGGAVRRDCRQHRQQLHADLE